MAVETKAQIVAAAGETLKARGFAGTSTRAIAATGGFNPGLIFYYYGSLHELLVAVLAESSAARLARYRSAVEDAATIAELFVVLRWIYREDYETGYVRVVSELVAGGIAHRELGPRVVELMEPWIELAEGAIERALTDSPFEQMVAPRELALAAITFYLGANLLTQLLDESAAVERLLDLGEQAAPMLELLRQPR